MGRTVLTWTDLWFAEPLTAAVISRWLCCVSPLIYSGFSFAVTQHCTSQTSNVCQSSEQHFSLTVFMNEVSAVRLFSQFAVEELVWSAQKPDLHPNPANLGLNWNADRESYRPTSGPDFTNTPVAEWEQRFTEDWRLLQQQNHSFALRGSTNRHMNRVVLLVHELLCRCVRRLHCLF